MPSEKFSISLPSDLAAELAALAQQDGVSRSFVIQEATTRYLVDRTSRDEVSRRRASVGCALAAFDEIATRWGDDPRQGIDYLAELRAPTDESSIRDDVPNG